MAQQINLLTPILLAPKRHFSALALAQATALVLLACVGAALWIALRDHQAESGHRALLARLAAEREQLTAARAALPVPKDGAALQSQVRALRAGNDERRAVLQMLAMGHGADEQAGGQRHSDLLALLARSLPDAAWVSELNYAPGRVELVGGTLDTAVLRPWLGQLAAHPLLAGQQLSALRVEQLGTAPAGAAKPLLAGAGPIAQAGLPVWAFRVVSAPAGAASGATR
ncbi:PilN domain-containing protein [Roseateles sp. BYS96W]|uniref:PilN domain-containing protein n=1 Tax=Pelomonas nitida TaxID=3299027 RepID=A0ABW7G250_9BURK